MAFTMDMSSSSCAARIGVNVLLLRRENKPYNTTSFAVLPLESLKALHCGKMTAFLDCLWWINIGASSFQWRISDTVYSIFVSHSIGGSVMVFLHKSVRNQNNRAAASDVDAFLLNAVQDNKCIRCVKIFNAHCSIGCANVSFCVMYYMCTIAVHNV